jgi:serine protease
MRKRLLVSVLAAGFAMLASTVGASADGIPGAHAKVFRPVGFQQQAGRTPNAPTASSANLVYNGGSVLTRPGIFLIYWGPDWATGFSTNGFTSSQAQTYVNSFYTSVGGNSWLNSTVQYCQGIAVGSQFCNGAGQSVTNPSGQLLGIWNDPTTVPRSPSDAQVRAAAQRGAQHFGFNRNALYMVFTPHGKNISGFGTQFCAYHDNTTFNGSPLAYSNIPYIPDAAQSCGRNFVNGSNNSFGNGYFDGFSIVTGHEYAEAITDAFPSQTIAWLANNGQENGDLCAWGQGPGPQSASQNISVGSHSFAVQSLWSNRVNNTTGGCSINLG